MSNFRVVDQYDKNSEPNFAALKKAGIRVYIHKLSEGAHSRLDSESGASKAKRRIAAARRAGLRVGGYHFARPDLHPGVVGARQEAVNYVLALKGIGHRPGDLKPILDFETETRTTSREQEAWIRAFNKVVKARIGDYPIFYSYPWLTKSLRLRKPVGSGLWYADSGQPDAPPFPWKNVYLRQVVGKINGVSGPVDLSSFGSKFGVWPLVFRPIRSVLRVAR